MQACTNPDILRIISYILKLLDVVFIILPIGLILIIGIDFFKNVIASKESDMQKNLNIVIKRIIFCVCIFFVPTIVSAVNAILNEINLGVNYTQCLTNANDDYIERRTIEIAEELIEEASSTGELTIALEAEEAISKIKDENKKEELGQRIKVVKQQILESLKQNNKDEENTYIPSGKTSGTNDGDGSSNNGSSSGNSSSTDSGEINGSGETTGYLKSPINPKATQLQFITSIGSNSKTLYYLAGGYHGGTDLPVVTGTNIYAVDGGTVYKVQDGCGSYGRHIILEHIVNNKKYYTIYAHLSSIENKYKTKGTKVSQGTLIAKSGNSYHCSGQTTLDPHLHIGISYNSNGSFPQTEGDKSFLIGNFIGTNTSYSIVDDSNLSYYKQKHY